MGREPATPTANFPVLPIPEKFAKFAKYGIIDPNAASVHQTLARRAVPLPWLAIGPHLNRGISLSGQNHTVRRANASRPLPAREELAGDLRRHEPEPRAGARDLPRL